MSECENGFIFHKWAFKGIRKVRKKIYSIHECERCGEIQIRKLEVKNVA